MERRIDNYPAAIQMNFGDDVAGVQALGVQQEQASRLDSAGSSKINKSIGSGSADAEQFFVIQGVDGIAVFRVVAVEVGVAGRPMLHPTENGGHFGGR